MDILLCFLIAIQTHCVLAVNVSTVRPTYPEHVYCDDPTADNCCTLNEQIENGVRIFANDTIQMLLPGLHVINSTKQDTLLIENVKSLVFTGEQGETTVSCVHSFALNFSACSDVTVSNVIFISCVLVFSNYMQNINIANLTIVNSKLQIYKYLNYLYYTLNTFLGLESTYFGTIDGERPCKIQENVSISKVTFQNSSMVTFIETELFEYAIVSCINLQLSGIVIKDILNSDYNHRGLHLCEVYSVTIGDLTVRNISFVTMFIQSVFKLTLVNIRVNDNYSPLDPIITLRGIINIEIKGQFVLKRNSGKGVLISAVNNITFLSNSTVGFYHHQVIEDLLHIDSLTYRDFERNTNIKFKNTKLIFENNTSEQGAIIIFDVVNIKMTYIEIVVENNTSYQLDTWNHWSNKPSATMLLIKSTAYIHHSKLKFVNNSASLSGGLTLTSSDLIVRNVTFNFEHNTGGEGGAIAFYAKSHITPLTKKEGFDCLVGFEECPLYMLSTQMHFRQNKARKRGGAIFIQDSDYINSMTRMEYDYFIHNQRKDMLDIRFLTQDNIVLNFSNNSADIVGNEVYGGWIDLYHANSIYCTWILPENDQFAVASNPTRICMCTSLVPV